MKPVIQCTSSILVLSTHVPPEQCCSCPCSSAGCATITNTSKTLVKKEREQKQTQSLTPSSSLPSSFPLMPFFSKTEPPWSKCWRNYDRPWLNVLPWWSQIGTNSETEETSSDGNGETKIDSLQDGGTHRKSRSTWQARPRKLTPPRSWPRQRETSRALRINRETWRFTHVHSEHYDEQTIMLGPRSDESGSSHAHLA